MVSPFRASAGFKLALHHHLDLAVMRQEAFNVAPGTETRVALTPVLTVTTETARLGRSIRGRTRDILHIFQAPLQPP